MMIRLGYDIQFETVGEVPIVTLLNVHPSRTADLREPDELRTGSSGEDREVSGRLWQPGLPPACTAGKHSVPQLDSD